MNQLVEEALRKVRTLHPDNIHLRTNATYGQIVDFQSIWWNHTPTAAQYYLLHHYWTGKLVFKEE